MCLQKIIQKIKKLFRKPKSIITPSDSYTAKPIIENEEEKSSNQKSNAYANNQKETLEQKQRVSSYNTNNSINVNTKNTINQQTKNASVRISDDTFEKIRLAKLNNLESSNSTILSDWIKKVPECQSLTEFIQYMNAFEYYSTSILYKDRNKKQIFLELMLQDKRTKNSNFAIDYYFEDASYSNLRFEMIFLLKGYDYALSLLNAPQMVKKIKPSYREDYKAILSAYQNKDLIIEKSGYYDSFSGLYIVHFKLYKNYQALGSEGTLYSSDFNLFYQALNKDRRSINLFSTPLTPNQLNGCISDERTRFPLSNTQTYATYKVLKGYDNYTGYYVTQEWFDEQNRLILEHKRKFPSFQPFIDYLEKDLSNGNFLSCPDLKQINAIQGINWADAQREDNEAYALGIKKKEIKPDLYKETTDKRLDLALRNEKLSSISIGERDVLIGNERRPEFTVYYISDLHLEFRFKTRNCWTTEDYQNTWDYIKGKFRYPPVMSWGILAIAGDTASVFNTFKYFINKVPLFASHGFICLGNHELWPMDFIGKTLDEIIATYRSIMPKSKRWHLVQNNLFYLVGDNPEVYEISPNELQTLTIKELRSKVSNASRVIFGGIGFAGKNETFNAHQGIYVRRISREEEIRQSEIFNKLYKKVEEACHDRNVLVLTHRPRSDWSDEKPNPNFYYVNGHTHRNYFCNTQKRHVYADNQVGYTAKQIKLKYFLPNYGCDIFKNYSDGIYAISQPEYISFYHGRNERISRNSSVPVIHRLKKSGYYRFFTENTKGELRLLNKGARRIIDKNNNLQYYYDHRENYYTSLSLFLSKYQKYRESLSQKIKSIGGKGYIHGCIINLDYYNHIYVNPLDGKITPYYASSITDKYIYQNLPSLLKSNCPEMYKKYVELSTRNESSSKEWDLITSHDNSLSFQKTPVSDTTRYRISKIIHQLQYSLKYKVIRIWNDAFAKTSSSDNGKNIVEKRLLENTNTK